MSTSAPQTQNHGSVWSYTTGFVLSILLTIIPFMIIINTWMEGWTLVWFFVAFAVLQLMVQLIFFLHIGKGASAQWNITVFGFMIFFVLIVVVGSLWVMHHLNYNMLPPIEIDSRMREEAQKGF